MNWLLDVELPPIPIIPDNAIWMGKPRTIDDLLLLFYKDEVWVMSKSILSTVSDTFKEKMAMSQGPVAYQLWKIVPGTTLDDYRFAFKWIHRYHSVLTPEERFALPDMWTLERGLGCLPIAMFLKSSMLRWEAEMETEKHVIHMEPLDPRLFRVASPALDIVRSSTLKQAILDRIGEQLDMAKRHLSPKAAQKLKEAYGPVIVMRAVRTHLKLQRAREELAKSKPRDAEEQEAWEAARADLAVRRARDQAVRQATGDASPEPAPKTVMEATGEATDTRRRLGG